MGNPIRISTCSVTSFDECLLTFFGFVCLEVSIGDDAGGLARLNGHNADDGLRPR